MSKFPVREQVTCGRDSFDVPSHREYPPSHPSHPEKGYAEREVSEWLGMEFWHVSDASRKADLPRGAVVLLPDEVTELCRLASTSGRDAARAYAMRRRHVPRAKLKINDASA